MRTLRCLTIATAAITALVVATPALAQTTNTPAPGINAWPSFAPTPAPAPRAAAGEKQQGLGVFLQGGWLRMTTYGDNFQPTGNLSNAFPGWVIGIGFGGNKSGHFGLGADVNYLIKSQDNAEIGTNPILPTHTGQLKLHYLEVPFWGRVNFMGTNTKNAPTLYVMFGGFVDILLKGQIGSDDVKSFFNGFDFGPLVGVGFEVARVGVEVRGNWAMKSLQNTGDGTFLNGVQDSKAFTLVVLFKVRVH